MRFFPGPKSRIRQEPPVHAYWISRLVPTYTVIRTPRLFGTIEYAVARTEHAALVKSTMKIFSNFVAFSENPNFKPKMLIPRSEILLHLFYKF